MNSEVHIKTLSNGLTVIVEEMQHVESAAYDLLIPGGIIADQPESIGASLILAELTSRGAGDLDARQLMEQFDDLGVRHGESAGHDRYFYHGGLIADTLADALKLVAKMVKEPTFPVDEIDPIRSVFLQDISSIGDNPSRRAMMELSQRYYPSPYNRPSTGTVEGLMAIDQGVLKALWSQAYRPHGAILSVAGNISTSVVVAQAEELFSDWSGTAPAAPTFGAVTAPMVHHIEHESSQLQIVLAYPSAPFGDPDYYVAKVVAGILSGGMFGRLFIEVREKRGLVYSVYARHSATNLYGTMSVYAGTTPERAQETLDVTLHELNNVLGTVTDEELRRAKANLKASVIMGDESSSSRASSSASDYWLMKRIRSLEEIQQEIDRVSAEDIDKFIKRFPPQHYSLLTLGSRTLAEPGLRSLTGVK